MPRCITHETTGTVLADEVSWASSFRARARGLIGRELKPGAALVFERASQIHTFGMSYPIDVLFCGADWSIVHLVRALPPNRVTRWVRRSRRVIELPGGSLPPELVVGDRLLVT
ncbi:MAG TPA: DUF192 domain-containing protein [Actinomycetota bacterium]|nr:DUF192 domain-containing protein [Actinomycetota bacterium]